jgi:hypothetical protein
MFSRRAFLVAFCAVPLLFPGIAASSTDPEPTWTEVPVIQNPDPGRYGPVLADVISRLPKTGIGSSQAMYSPAWGTWTHEGTHGVNSRVRNKLAPRGHNASYVLGGRAIVVKEPRPITLAEVARYVPVELRGRTYKRYMVDATRSPQPGIGHWNDNPLYTHDEWSAYVNGATYYLDATRRGKSLNGTLVSLDFCAEMAIYSLCVAVAVDKAQRDGRLVGYDEEQLKLSIAWQWDRMMQLFADCQPYIGKGFKDPIPYYRVFSHGEPGKPLRAWCRSYFGADWCASVMRISSD